MSELSASERKQGTRANFVWRDGGRTVVFRDGALAAAGELLAEHGFDDFELVSTERGLGSAPGLAEKAAAVHRVAQGGVPEAAAPVLAQAGEAARLRRVDHAPASPRSRRRCRGPR